MNDEHWICFKVVITHRNESKCAISPTAVGLFLIKKQFMWNQCACFPSKKADCTIAASRRSP